MAHRKVPAGLRPQHRQDRGQGIGVHALGMPHGHAAQGIGHRPAGTRIDGVRACSNPCQQSPDVASAPSRREMRRGSASSPRPSAACQGCPSGRSPQALSSPPISSRPSAQPACCNCCTTQSTAKPLAMPLKSSCTPPGCHKLRARASYCTRCQPQCWRAVSMTHGLGTTPAWSACGWARGPNPQAWTKAPRQAS